MTRSSTDSRIPRDDAAFQARAKSLFARTKGSHTTHASLQKVEIIRSLVAAVEAKDPYTRKHSLTVAAYAQHIGERMRLSQKTIATIRSAALLHDVGKIGVPDGILTKPAPLTDEEVMIVRRHPAIAIDILAGASYLREEKPLILYHHERFDGSGYPEGLRGVKIPIGARVLGVADAVDAMFSPRSYKGAYHLHRVRQELAKAAGTQFDPDVVEAALEWLAKTPPSEVFIDA